MKKLFDGDLKKIQGGTSLTSSLLNAFNSLFKSFFHSLFFISAFSLFFRLFGRPKSLLNYKKEKKKAPFCFFFS